MTSLSRFPSANTTCSAHHDPRQSGHFLPRPLSTISTYSAEATRRLSACSSLSAVSIASSTGSATGDRRRRSAILLDLERNFELGEGRSTIRNSLQRAEEVLRASEREREVERRRSRLSFRNHQVRRTSQHLDQLFLSGGDGPGEYVTETLSPGISLPSSSRRQNELESPTSGGESKSRRFSPKRLLQRARSIPIDLSSLVSRSPPTAPKLKVKKQPYDSDPSAGLSSAGSPSPPSAQPLPLSRPSPRRAASALEILSSASTHPPAPSPQPSPLQVRRGAIPLYATLPAASTLTLPDNEPPSKFSASSGDSLVRLVGFSFGSSSAATAENGGKGFKDRARTFSGLGSLKRRTSSKEKKEKTGGEKKVRKKPSLAGLFGALSNSHADSSASGGEEKPTKAKSGRGRGISFASSSKPASSSSVVANTSSGTSSHRPSTSISSYAASTTTTSDSAHSQQQQKPSRKPSRLGFFRTIRESTAGSIRSRSVSRASGSISPSIISRPVSISTASSIHGSAGDRRFSISPTVQQPQQRQAPSSSETSGKRGWAVRMLSLRGGKSGMVGASKSRGGNVAAKRALFEGKESPTVQLAERVQVEKTQSPTFSTRPPSRIPLSNIFPRQSAAPPARPPRPESSLHSGEDTVFYGHRVPASPAVKSRAAVIDSLVLTSSAPRVRAKTSIPVARGKAAPQSQPFSRPHHPPLPPAASKPSPGHFGLSAPSGALLPPAPIYPAHSFPSKRQEWHRDSLDVFSSSDESPASPSSSGAGGFTSDESRQYRNRAASPFRSPSPARFRDLLPSATAQSSPERDERGLPLPLEEFRGTLDEESPRKRAMGPEQAILMEDVHVPRGPINEVKGATSDLADLLSSIEDTSEVLADGGGNDSSFSSSSTRFSSRTPAQAIFERRPHVQVDVSDLSGSLRCHLPHLNSMETLRSTVSDVPPDLKDLMDAVDDHISEVDVLPSFAIEGSSMGARGFADENNEILHMSDDSSSDSDGSTSSDEEEHEQQHHLAAAASFGAFLTVGGVGGDHTTGAFSSDGGTTLGYDATASSFEGHFSTAGAVLRSVLAPSIPPVPSIPAHLQEVPEDEELSEEEEDDPRMRMSRDSAREALEIERPSHGSKMFDRFDDGVALSALAGSPSPVQPHQASFLRHHFRNNSALSSTEGSLESHFSTASPTPYPRSGRPVRQSLARYSQEQFPTKRPSHRARPISEQSTTSASSEHDRLSSNDPTTNSFAPSNRSTNLSIASITSSPCPAPKYRRVPMLGRQPPPQLGASFRFPLPKSSVKMLGERASFPPELDERVGGSSGSREEDGRGPSGSKTSASPRFVRPLRGSLAGEPLPRPRLLDLQLQQVDDPTVPPDTPPPSSPSSGDSHGFSSREASFEMERPRPSQAATGRNSSKAGHSRQTSRSSSVLKMTIVEEFEDLPSPSEDVSIEVAVRMHVQPLSPVHELPSPPAFSPQTFPRSPCPELPALEFSPPFDLNEPSSRVIVLEESSDDDGFEFTAETNPETTRRYIHTTYEADMEIKRSVTMWPDTEASKEAVALFDAPRTYHAILEFIFWSQNRFPSPPHLLRLHSFVPAAFDDPPTPPSPIRIPSPIVDSSFETQDRLVYDLSSREPSPVRKPAPIFRQPLAPKAHNKQVAALSSSTSSPSKAPKDDHSPFTALPPRLGSKLRAVRAKMTSKSPKQKAVDTTFLGEKVSNRRQEQIEAAMRRLEGTGRPGEQRSDGESTGNLTGVLEGEATGELSFSKTPRHSKQRPRVRRKPALTTIR